MYRVSASMSETQTTSHLGGAFYGDRTLQAFLLERLLKLHKSGGIVEARFPHWSGTKGSPTAALVRHASVDVFSRLTGLPQAMATCLHFACGIDEPSVEQLFSSITAGQDTEGLSVRFLHRWLSDEVYAWHQLLGVDADRLRLQWLAACDRLIAGQAADGDEWPRLARQAESLRSQEPALYARDIFASMMQGLCAPPDDDSGRAWDRALLAHGSFFLTSQACYARGWRDEQFIVEPIRLRWFAKHYPSQRRLSYDEAKAARDRYELEHRDLEAAFRPFELDLLNNFGIYIQPYRNRLRDQLIELLGAR